MIARLKGLVEEIGEDGVVIDVGGVGYQAFCSARTIAALPAPGGAACLHIITHVREDHIHLYGFATVDERAWFRRLMTVQGVGARVALTVLSALAPEQVQEAIAAQDKSALVRAEGVGPKLAARIISELRDQANALPAVPAGVGGRGAMDAETEDALSALVNLGYGRAEAFGAVNRAVRALGRGAGVTALVPAALKELMREPA